MFRIAVALTLCLTAACARRAQRPSEPVAPETPAAVEPPRAAPAAPPQPRAAPGLQFEVEPPEAEVFIDERSYGAASQLGHVPLPPGIYRVSIRARGHTTWRAEVSVGDAAEILKVTLPPRS